MQRSEYRRLDFGFWLEFLLHQTELGSHAKTLYFVRYLNHTGKKENNKKGELGKAPRVTESREKPIYYAPGYLSDPFPPQGRNRGL